MIKDVLIASKIAIKDKNYIHKTCKYSQITSAWLWNLNPPKSQELHNVVTFSAYMTQKNRVTEGRTLVTQVKKNNQKIPTFH